MIPRLTLLLMLLVGFALGPVRGGCGEKAGGGGCGGCCGDPAAACCASSCAPEPEMPPVQSAPTADDGKQLPAPNCVLAGFSPAPVVERPAVRRRQAARMPVVSRLDLICVRLI